MKKIIGMIALVLVGALLFAACAKEEGARYDYDLSEYIELPDIRRIEAPFSDPTVCTEEEIDYTLHQIMLSYAEFSAKEGESVIEKFDKAVVDYKIFQGDKELEEYSQADYGIVVGYDGNGAIDYTLAQELVGKKVGDTCRVSYTFPTDDVSLGSWAGVTVECEGTVKEILRSHVPECTDEFVQQLEKFNFQTVQEFRDQLKLDNLEQKMEAKKTAVLDTFIKTAKVKKYPDAELKKYVEEYITDLKSMAEEMDMEYGDYLQEYMQATEDEINELALKDARVRVKNDMACLQANRILDIKLTEKEYQEGLKGYFEKKADQFEDIEAFEAHYTRAFMEDCIRWDKTFEIMVEGAVSTLEAK